MQNSPNGDIGQAPAPDTGPKPGSKTTRQRQRSSPTPNRSLPCPQGATRPKVQAEFHVGRSPIASLSPPVPLTPTGPVRMLMLTFPTDGDGTPPTVLAATPARWSARTERSRVDPRSDPGTGVMTSCPNHPCSAADLPNRRLDPHPAPHRPKSGPRPSLQAHLSRSAFSFRQTLRRPFPGRFNARTHSHRNDFAPHGSSVLGGDRLLLNHSTSSLFHRVIPLALTDNPTPETQKPAKAHHAWRVLSPDPFVLLTLSLCHKQKNKSRTFFKNLRSPFPAKILVYSQ